MDYCPYAFVGSSRELCSLIGTEALFCDLYCSLCFGEQSTAPILPNIKRAVSVSPPSKECDGSGGGVKKAISMQTYPFFLSWKWLAGLGELVPLSSESRLSRTVEGDSAGLWEKFQFSYNS